MANDCKVIVDEKTVELLVSPEILARRVAFSLSELPCRWLNRSVSSQMQVPHAAQSNLRGRQLLHDMVSSSKLRVRDPVLGSSAVPRRRHPDRDVRVLARVLLRVRTRWRPSTLLLSDRQEVEQEMQR